MSKDPWKEQGGPAFPTQNASYAFYKGMSLRQYFAAHAPEVPDMQTFPIKQWTELEVIDLGDGQRGRRNVMHQESWAARNARWAFEYADSMLAEMGK